MAVNVVVMSSRSGLEYIGGGRLNPNENVISRIGFLKCSTTKGCKNIYVYI